MYNVLNQVFVETVIEQNPYQFAEADLFDVAARINKKRSFLFVSKVLGKHLAVEPHIPLLTGALLAMHSHDTKHPLLGQVVAALQTKGNLRDVYEQVCQHPVELSEPTLVIGFAETATALGHAYFTACRNAMYIHTTREQLMGVSPLIRFEEEHSHATSHRLYAEDDVLTRYRNIVLVDDEMSTGQTNLNIIEQLKRTYPQIEAFTVVSILDWRNEEQRAQYDEVAQALDVTITAAALMSGRMQVRGELDETDVAPKKARAATEVRQLYVESDVIHHVSRSENGSICTTPYAVATGRFGLTRVQELAFAKQLRIFSENLSQAGKRLVVGTGECMYVPMSIAANLAGEVYVKSTTRSPIYCHEATLIQQKYTFESPENAGVTNYLYNIAPGAYDEIVVVVERVASKKGLAELVAILQELVETVTVVTLAKPLEPDMRCTYEAEDVTFVLRDLSEATLEKSTEEREQLIQGGMHYSEMLPQEFQPDVRYMELFEQMLARDAKKLARLVGTVAEQVVSRRDVKCLVLVSLARAGTPIGILMKRYIAWRYQDVPHYTVSILRGKGIDEAALLYILQKHPDAQLQFVDGWTGKGAITRELESACASFKEKYGIELSAELAVLADPSSCAHIYGTREDVLIPSACLNSTVSGLVSRTVQNEQLLAKGDFHGAKFYADLVDSDVSRLYVDKVAQHFEVCETGELDEPTWAGQHAVARIQEQFGITNQNYIKPGIGETTRVLLRRIPWKVLVRPDAIGLEHIYMLARERGVPIEAYANMDYACCGLIREVKK